MMKLNLADSVSSPGDLQAVMTEIRQYARWYSHNSIKKRLKMRHTAEKPPAVSAATAAVLRDWTSKTPLSQASLDALLKTLGDAADHAPQITITLAALPTGDIKKTLVAWCRHNLGSDILVNFQFNSTLLGGMVVRYGSHIFDWSFRQQILAARHHFPEVLRNVR